MSKKKVHPLRPTVKLWGAIRIVAWLFIALAVLLMAGFARQGLWLGGLAPGQPFTETEIYDAMPVGDMLLMSSGLLYFPVYLVGAFLTLRWYLRSLRNAHRLHRGFETSPAWAIWGFIIPVVSLFKPYGMTSELWRSSARPDRWKGMKDPALLRWWWGLVLLGGFLGAAADITGRYAYTAGQLRGSAFAMVGSLLTLVIAALLFLRIGGAISRRQTALVEARPEASPSAEIVEPG